MCRLLAIIIQHNIMHSAYAHSSKIKMELTLQVLALLTYLVGAATCSTVCFDHQSTEYKAQFKPAACNQKCTVTPFFSPDHSLDTYLDLIQSATETIDIYTPGETVVFNVHTSKELDLFMTPGIYSSVLAGKIIALQT